jgi:hypothetical protein
MMTTTTFVLTDQSVSLLRYAMRADAIFSELSGLFFIGASSWIASFLGLPAAGPAILMMGIIFLFYGAGLWYFSQAEYLNPTTGSIAVAIDVAWVVASAVILATGVLGLSTSGQWAVLLVADVVLGFAAWKFFGTRRLR